MSIIPLSKYTWKRIEPDDYFKDIEIPDDWDTIEDFVDWYLDQRMPMMIPWNSEVIRSDDAAAICLFRKGNYQVELYLQLPRTSILLHSHPRMEVITMSLGGGCMSPPAEKSGCSDVWGTIEQKLTSDQQHGGSDKKSLADGFVTLTFQRWDYPEEMSSAAVQWKGQNHVEGGYQQQLIERYKPDAKFDGATADVSETAPTKAYGI